MTKTIPKGEVLLEDLQSRMDYIKIAFSKHFTRERSFERAFARSEILQTLKYGWIIEYDPRDKKACVLGYTAEYRPIHVIIAFGDVPVVITAYNPKSKKWKWNKSFDKRTCFCK